MTEDEMVRWYHQLNGHEFEQTPGDSEGQGSLTCCSPWGCKESDTTEQLKNIFHILECIYQSQSPNLSLLLPYALVTISLFSTSVTLFLFYK